VILQLRAQPTAAERRATRILAARTRALAARGGAGGPAVPLSPPLLLCALGAETYGLPLEAVLRVVPAAPCTPAPGQPAAMLGFFGRAGQVFIVLDLGLALGLRTAPGTGTPDGHFLLLRQGPRRFALRVDRALGAPGPLPLAEGPGDDGGPSAVTTRVTAETPAGPGLAGVIDLPRLLRPFLPDPASPGA
jgi:hypothetical protein